MKYIIGWGIKILCKNFKQLFLLVKMMGHSYVYSVAVIKCVVELNHYCKYDLQAEIVGVTFVVSQFRVLRVGSRISVLHVIILPGTQTLKVGSWISDWSWFCFSFLTFYVAPSRVTWPGVTRNEKKWLLGKYPIRNYYTKLF